MSPTGSAHQPVHHCPDRSRHAGIRQPAPGPTARRPPRPCSALREHLGQCRRDIGFPRTPGRISRPAVAEHPCGVENLRSAPDNGTRRSRLAFKRVAGIVRIKLSRLISSQVANRPSANRAAVSTGTRRRSSRPLSSARPARSTAPRPPRRAPTRACAAPRRASDRTIVRIRSHGLSARNCMATALHDSADGGGAPAARSPVFLARSGRRSQGHRRWCLRRRAGRRCAGRRILPVLAGQSRACFGLPARFCSGRARGGLGDPWCVASRRPRSPPGSRASCGGM